MQQSPARSEPSRFTPDASGAEKHRRVGTTQKKSMIEHDVRVCVPLSAIVKFRLHAEPNAGSPAREPLASHRLFDRLTVWQDSATDGSGGAA